MNWNGTFLHETLARHDEVNSSIDVLLNFGGFMHVGSTLGHQSALHEGMKQYVCAISCLREDAALKKPKMTVSGLTMVGMGILLCQVRYCFHSSDTRIDISGLLHWRSTFDKGLTCCEEIRGSIGRLVFEHMAESHHWDIRAPIRQPAR